jgi:hypothetical protein
VMKPENQRKEFENELVDVEVGAEVAFFLGDPNGTSYRRKKPPPRVYKERAYGTRPVVKLRSCGQQRTAPGEVAVLMPSQPAIEQRANPRHPSFELDGRTNNMLDKLRLADFEHRDLQHLFRTKMGEDSTLGEPQIARETPDAEAFQTFHTGARHRPVKYPSPRSIPPRHQDIERTFVRFVKRAGFTAKPAFAKGRRIPSETKPPRRMTSGKRRPMRQITAF